MCIYEQWAGMLHLGGGAGHGDVTNVKYSQTNHYVSSKKDPCTSSYEVFWLCTSGSFNLEIF